MDVNKKISLMIALLIGNFLFGQVKKYSITGVLRDKQHVAIIGANVVALNSKDSVLVSFTESDEVGKFILKNIKTSEVRLQITYTGFGTIEKVIPITGETTVIDLGEIVLAEQESILGEVIVKADFVPIKIKKDTVEYNADAFRVRPNANVEELLKKLPGVEVDASGNITAQGEEVKQVTVDGKKFFGNDPKMATQNLPADAVQKVQIVDKKSEKAQFSGISDGETEKIINLELKANKKIGSFGEILAGYGTSDRFETKLNVNRFKSNFQVSAIGNFNNLSNQGLSFADYNSLTGGSGFSRSGGGNNTFGNSLVNFGGNSSGRVKSGTGGVNLYYEFSPKYVVSTSYFLQTSNQDLKEKVIRNNLFASESFDSDKNTNSLTKRIGHTFNLSSQMKPDSFHRLDIEGSVRINDTKVNSSLTSISESKSVSNNINQKDKRITDLIDLSVRSVFSKRLRKAGRIFSTELSYGTTDNEIDYEIDRKTFLPISAEYDSLLQEQHSFSDDQNYRIYAEYKEPLGKNNYLGFGFTRRNYSSLQDKQFYDVDFFNPAIKILNTIQSNLTNNDVTFNRASLLYTIDKENYSFNADLAYQISALNNVIGSSEFETKPFKFFLPGITFNWLEKNIRIRYNTSVNEPSVSQLQPLLNNADPQNLYIGNPLLKPEYNHNFNVRYNFFDNFNFRNLFLFVNYRYTQDKIVTGQSINPSSLIRTSSPLNTKDQQVANLNLSFSSPIKVLHIKTRLNLGGSISKSINIQNLQNIDVTTSSPRASVDIENINNQVVSLLIGYDWSFSSNKYSTGRQNVDFTTQGLRSTLMVNFGKGFSLDGDLIHNIYSKENFGDNNTLTLLNGGISKRLFNDRLTAKFRIGDILNIGQGIARNVTETYIEESTTNAIGRYAMFTLSYRLSAFAPQQNMPQGQLMGPRGTVIIRN